MERLRRQRKHPTPVKALSPWMVMLVAVVVRASASDGNSQEQASPQAIPFTSPTVNTTIFVTPINAFASGTPSVTWEASPACTAQPTPYNSVADLSGRRWGLTGDAAVNSRNLASSSCAFKNATGVPVFSWETAPRCLMAPSVLNAVADGQGRLWGQQFGLACAFKAADSDRPVFDFLTAPACSSKPEPVTSESDASGRLWGWECGRECAYKDGDNTPLQLPAASTNLTDMQAVTPAEMIARGAVPTAPSITWRASPRCTETPSKFNSEIDSRGRLWGWEQNASCAFKDASGVPAYDWVTAPRCLGDVMEGSSVDQLGRLWGSEAGSPCAFKDLRQQPLRIWVTAARCPTLPSLDTAVPDEQGRLWGWSGNTSCAYRDDKGNALTFAPNTTSPVPPPLAQADAQTLREAVAASSPPPPPRLSQREAADSSGQPSTARAYRRAALGGKVSQRSESRGAAGAGIHAAHRQNSRAQARAAAASKHQAVSHRRLLDSLSAYPSCQTYPAPASIRPDSYGRYWGSEGGSSCIYRDGSGNPATLWNIVPACSPTASVQSTDGLGRSWGWENSRTCAFKATGSVGSASNNGSSSNSGSSTSAASADPNDLWTSAPACAASPTTSNSKADSKGRLWGWENSASCAFKGSTSSSSTTTSLATAVSYGSATVSASSGSSATASSDSSSSQAPSIYATGDVNAAPSCSGTPTMDTSQPDDIGYLWGWQDGRACVFRGSDGKVLYYAALITGDWSAQPGYVPKGTSKSGWFDAPRCSQPPTWAAKPDSEGRLWGYENGQGCVFRDARGYPMFYSDLQSGNVAEYYNNGSVWDNSPRCPGTPSWSTARADNYGRLWGWDNTASSSCAYKDASGQPIYPPKQ